jgi:hypothetical protein
MPANNNSFALWRTFIQEEMMDQQQIEHIRRSARELIDEWVKEYPEQQIPPTIGHWLLELCRYIDDLKMELSHYKAVDI